MQARKQPRKTVWKRSDVPCCNCPCLGYTHTHCLCTRCQGRAVSRATEYRHWSAARREMEMSTDIQGSSFSAESNSPTTTANAIVDASGSGELNVDGSGSGELNVDGSGSGERNVDGSGSTTHATNSRSAGCSNTTTASSVTTEDIIASDLVWSIVEAMQLVEDTNSSQHDFLATLHFGKHLYKRGLSVSSESGANEELKEKVDSLWPNTWQGAMKLMQQAGYQPPKKLSVCLSESHVLLWDVMGEGEKCRHCGENGQIPYYYLTLSDKVRTSYRCMIKM